jgi:hypothetical protein
MNNEETKELRIKVDKSVYIVFCGLAKRLGISRLDLTRLWMSLIDPEDERLKERVRHMKVVAEIDRWSKTRNTLIGKLKERGVLQQLNELSNDDFKGLLDEIEKRKAKSIASKNKSAKIDK